MSLLLTLRTRVTPSFHGSLRLNVSGGADLRTSRSVDLFVRQSNNLAIGLYESLGYMIYRRVQAYYGGGPGEKDEDAYGEFGSSLSLPDLAHAFPLCIEDLRCDEPS